MIRTPVAGLSASVVRPMRTWFPPPPLEDPAPASRVFGIGGTDAVSGAAQPPSLADLLLEQLPFRAYIKDADGIFVYVNPACARDLAPAAPESVVGRSDDDFFDRTQSMTWRRQEEEVLTGGAPVLGQLEEEIRLDGRKVWVKTWKFREAGGRLIGFSMDITQEQATIIREDRLLDSAPCWIFVKRLNPETNKFYFSYVNRTLVGALVPGGEKSDVVGETDAHFFAEEQVRKFHEKDMELFRNGGRADIEAETVGDRIVATTKIAIEPEDGDGPREILGVSTDITELMNVRARLWEQEDLFRLVMENVPAGIFFKEADGKFYRVNNALARLVGLEPGDMVGKSDFNFFPREYAERARAAEGEILRSGIPLEEPRKETVVDGRRTFRSVTKIPVATSGGRPLILGLSHDVTDLVEEERRSTAKGNLLRLVLDALPQRIYMKNERGEYTLCNAAFAKDHDLIGSPQELPDKKWTDADLWPPEAAEKFRASDREVLESVKPKGPYVEHSPNGDGKMVEITKLPFRPPGANEYHIVGVYDELRPQARDQRNQAYTSIYLSHLIRESQEPGRRLHLALLGLTHYHGAKFNRAIAWRYERTLHRLVPLGAVGQCSRDEAVELDVRVDKLETFDLDFCILEYDRRTNPADRSLLDRIGSRPLELRDRWEGVLTELIRNSIDEDKPLVRRFESPAEMDELSELMDSLGARECLVAVVPIARSGRPAETLVFCCDNIRSGAAVPGEDVEREVYLELLKRGFEDSVERERQAEDRALRNVLDEYFHNPIHCLDAALGELAEMTRDEAGSGDPGQLVQACVKHLGPVRQVFDALKRFAGAYEVKPDATLSVEDLVRLLHDSTPMSARSEFELPSADPAAWKVRVDRNKIVELAVELATNSVNVNGPGVHVKWTARFTSRDEMSRLDVEGPPDRWVVIEYGDSGRGFPPERAADILDGKREGTRGFRQGLGMRGLRVILEGMGGRLRAIGRPGGACFLIFLEPIGSRLGDHHG